MTTRRGTGRIWVEGLSRAWDGVSGWFRPRGSRSIPRPVEARPSPPPPPEAHTTAGSNTVLTGTADDIGMASVFKLLATAQRTGRLHVVRPSGSGTVFFDRGRIYQARSDLLTVTVGERLIDMGALGAEELRRAKDRAVTTGRTVEDVLHTSSGIDQESLQIALRQQMKAAAADIVTWEVGEFTWETGRVVAADVWIDIDVAELVSDVVEHETVPVTAPRRAAPPPPPPVERPSPAALLTEVSAPAAPADVRLASVPDQSASFHQQFQDEEDGGLRLAPPVRAPSETFSIAFVCTGNRFRSPITEALLQARVPDAPLTMVSVGRRDARPGPALPEAIEVAREFGVDLVNHRARPLAPSELKGFDLVLGFERAHVAEAVRIGAASRDRSFTLMEFADLLAEIGPIRVQDPIDRARVAVRRAHDHRRLVRKHGAAVDLVDPIGQTIGAYRNSAAQIARLVDRLVAGLFGDSSPQVNSPTPFWRGA